MLEFLKKNIFIIILSSITLFIGFLTFLTFIDRSFVELNHKNLQYLLILNIFFLFLLFAFIFIMIELFSYFTMKSLTFSSSQYYKIVVHLLKCYNSKI